MPDQKPNAARRCIGEHNGEFVLFDTWDSERDDLDPVHFAYVPLTPEQMQVLLKKQETSARSGAVRASVLIIAGQVRVWTAKSIKGDEVDPRSAIEVATKLDHLVVEGVSGRIIDGRSTHAAQAAIADFTKR